MPSFIFPGPMVSEIQMVEILGLPFKTIVVPTMCSALSRWDMICGVTLMHKLSSDKVRRKMGMMSITQEIIRGRLGWACDEEGG
jgi:hypothetical protein